MTSCLRGRSLRYALGSSHGERPSFREADFRHGLCSEASTQTAKKDLAPLTCGKTRQGVAPSKPPRTKGSRPLRGRWGTDDVGTSRTTGVLRLEYLHRTSGEGGLNDAQHRRHYPSPRGP